MKDLIRHGDVLLKPVDKLPDLLPNDSMSPEERRRVRKSKVILNGEVTGHAHRICEGEAEIIDYYEMHWREEKPRLIESYLHAKTDSVVTHEEHGPLPITPGLYEIVRAREFDYAANLSRRVMD